MSATDSDGVACSVTVSSGYGAGMIAEGTGIWLNNCLGEQELNPAGLHARPPGSRLLSNMAPTVGRHDDGSTLAIGSPGADRITTAITQVLAGFAAGCRCRRPSTTRASTSTAPDVRRGGQAETTSRCTTAAWARRCADADGDLDAAADPRRDGAVRLVEGPPDA